MTKTKQRRPDAGSAAIGAAASLRSALKSSAAATLPSAPPRPRAAAAAETEATGAVTAKAPQAAARADGPRSRPIDAGAAESGADALKKRDLLNMVAARTGAKKKDAKPIVDAMLAALGEAVAQGRELNLPPFGKVMINRTKEMSGGRVIVAKIRQKNPADPGKETLAVPAE